MLCLHPPALPFAPSAQGGTSLRSCSPCISPSAGPCRHRVAAPPRRMVMGSQCPAQRRVFLCPPLQGELLSTSKPSLVRNVLLQGGSHQQKAKHPAAGEGMFQRHSCSKRLFLYWHSGSNMWSTCWVLGSMLDPSRSPLCCTRPAPPHP